MGCGGSGLEKTIVTKTINEVNGKLKDAEGQLQDQLNGVVAMVDKPIDEAIGGVSTQVDSQTREIVTPLKDPLQTAVNSSTAPVDSVIGGFKEKTNFDTNQIQEIIKQPLAVVHAEINENKAKLKTTVGELCKEQAEKLDISDLELEGEEIGFKTRAKLKKEVEGIVDPQLTPVLATTDQSIHTAKGGIDSGLGPILAPVESVETELNAALETAEAPVNAVKAEANSKLEGLIASLPDLIKGPLQEAGAAAKGVVDAPIEVAENSFNKAQDAALAFGQKGISKVSTPEVQQVGNEELNIVASESKNRGKKMIVETRAKIADKINKCENEQGFAVDRLKKVPTEAVAAVFGDVLKPIDDIKKPVTEPIANAKKTVEDTRGTAFAELDGCKKEMVDFKGELIEYGVNQMIETLVATKGLKKGS